LQKVFTTFALFRLFCDDCGGADLTGDGRVTWDDLRELAYYWLAPLEISQMPPEKSDF